MIEIELTQEHIDKAIASTNPLISRCCPVWQAVSEALNRTDIEVGIDTVNFFYTDIPSCSYMTIRSACKAKYQLRPSVSSITARSRDTWNQVKPQTIELWEKEY